VVVRFLIKLFLPDEIQSVCLICFAFYVPIVCFHEESAKLVKLSENEKPDISPTAVPKKKHPVYCLGEVEKIS
jgi:hypothetical protein